LRNSNKQHLISAKLYVNNAPFIGSQNAEFQLNVPKQAIVKCCLLKLHKCTIT